MAERTVQVASDALQKASEKAKLVDAKGKKGAKASQANTGWTVPKFKHNFRLDAAKDMAYKRTEVYMNKVLGPDDMVITLKEEDGDVVGHVHDKHTQESISQYKGVDLLKLYAQKYKERGIIVDGAL